MKTNHSQAASRPPSTAYIACLVATVLLLFCTTDALQLFEDDVRVSKRRTGLLGGSLTVDSTPYAHSPRSFVVKDSTASNKFKEWDLDSFLVWLNDTLDIDSSLYSERSGIADSATRVPRQKIDSTQFPKILVTNTTGDICTSGVGIYADGSIIGLSGSSPSLVAYTDTNADYVEDYGFGHSYGSVSHYYTCLLYTSDAADE